jgi:tRNA A-37 threonylcarbamoyl transferase component Bud32
MMPPPLSRGSGSFMELHDSSPDPRGLNRLRTPHPPDVRQQHSSVSSGHAGSSAGSMFSGAATEHHAARPLRWGEHESPLNRKFEQPLETPRVPSCPVKAAGSSNVHKPRGKDEVEDIRPRTLDLGEADPVNGLSLSPMNMSAASPGAPPSAAGGSRVHARQPPEVGETRRPKRARLLSELGSQSSMTMADNMEERDDVPPPLFRLNSMADTKMLFARKDARSTSFCAVPGSEGAFKFDDHFVWGGKLGSGSFSEVYAVRHKVRPAERYAIKRSKREFHSRKERAEYLREVQLANDMPAHPNVAEYYRAWQDSYFFYVQMELCENGTLGQIMEREVHTLPLPHAEPRVWEMALHVARGLAHIHSYQVMHCDIKPDNILVGRDGAYKIGDLGQSIACKAWDEQEGDACYLSRDLLESNPSTAADIFSFGIMLFEIKSGEPLPGSGERWDFLRTGLVPPPAGCSELLGRVMHQMMSPQPTARPTAQDVITACCNAAAEAAIATAMSAAAS